jgi:hypothetical protein
MSGRGRNHHITLDTGVNERSQRPVAHARAAARRGIHDEEHALDPP